MAINTPMQSEQLLSYLQRGVDKLLEQGSFDGGQPFRPTQKQTLEAYKRFLESTSLTTEEKLKGFFEIPTGIGKTAVFVGIIAATHSIAEAEGQSLKTVIVVPTTQLLEQTHNSFIGTEKTIGFAPQLEGRIGLYGDGHKNLKLPITIMTYNAWYDLSQAGKIGSHNTDILISDEAHRGTSERRIENISGIFNAQTVQIAFTATAHFDEEKSVQASHEREIFYKSIRDAILEDELASYIGTQRAVIRVAPTNFMLSDEFQEATKQEKTAYRKKIREKAWNEFALKAYREGRDEQTGDLLTDNQAGFFVSGIHQANQLEHMLNDDEALQAIAKAQGRKGVAVAIHSHLSGKEQKRRFEAYMAGEYMAVVGDDKFKEGFDHPPMKTVIDSAHSSLVDKAQIIGRGARKWWNEQKGRFEGLTLIDNVIYIGSEDKDIDTVYRDAALRNAVSAKDILEDSFVIGPQAPKRSPSSALVGGPPNIFGDDSDIEYYSSIEEIYLLESEVSKLRKEDRIEITDEMRAHLRNEMERTGIGGVNLLKNTEVPEGLNPPLIISWGIAVQTAQKNLWSWVIEKYSQLPTVTARIEFSEENCKLLNAEFDRTGITSVDLLKLPNKPDTLTTAILQALRGGTNSSVSKDAYDWLITTLISLPEGEYKIISEEDLVFLVSEKKRTGTSIRKLLQGASMPSDLSGSMVNQWLVGAVKRAKKTHWSYVLKRFSELDTVVSNSIPMTEEMRRQLLSEIERTGVKANSLVTKSGVPESLTLARFQHITTKSSSVVPEEWEWIIGTYKSLPDAEVRITITKEMRAELISEKERTGAGGKALLLNVSENSHSVTSQLVGTWLSGKTNSASASQWNWVIETYKSLPSLKAREIIELTDAMRAELEAEVERTGLGVKKLFNQSSNPPPDLNPDKMRLWQRGAKSAQKDHWYWAIKEYKALSSVSAKINISDKMRQELKSEIERTGITPYTLLRIGKNLPHGTTYIKIHNWKEGTIKTAASAEWAWVINTYTSLPDKALEPSGPNNEP